MANSTKPGLAAVTTPAATDVFSTRQSGDTRDKKETSAQLQSVVLGISPAPAAPQANVDNLRLDGNTLSSTDTNGAVIVAPNGTGLVELLSAFVALGGINSSFAGLFTPGSSGILSLRTGDNSAYAICNADRFRAFTSSPVAILSTLGLELGSGVAINVSSAADGSQAKDTGQRRDSAGVWLDTNGSSGLGARRTGRPVEANTAGVGAPNLLAVNESRGLQHNTGVTAENYHTLPAGAPIGWEQDFACQDTDGIRVVAQAGETISVGPGVVSSAGGYVESVVVESLISLVKITATKYISRVIVGTWTAA